ncbi:N-acetylmuramoyl-L-alanine amidase [Mesonia sp.]|uniref:N-acetylmuramoyl-L-alanine amidase family protein n=1 Tax=Mesonia sp. TaxID=1960830 RepID=UPI001754681B|nr:N-acetylmuramoyl-L-alanine amidase [Mesonia sp.]HIB36860.1 N-acetylmuramoyl-L-alanine amidase [Mesonia sp.]
MKTFVKALFAICILGCFAFTINTNSTKETIKVVIDAGHGGKDSGQIVKGITEKEVVYQITQKINELHQNKNVEIFFSRPNNEFVSLEKRVEFINTIQPDLVISLHANGHPQDETKKGMEIYFSNKNKFSKENFEYGGQLSGIFIFSSAQQVEIKSANFTILSKVNSPALMLELGFLTNPEERAYLTSTEGQTEVANLILKFINEIE